MGIKNDTNQLIPLPSREIILNKLIALMNCIITPEEASRWTEHWEDSTQARERVKDFVV